MYEVSIQYIWILTINEPVDFMAQEVMILRQGKDIMRAMKVENFLG